MFFSTQSHTVFNPQRQQAQATTLRPGQIRVINASEGLTLKVLQGRMWVTRPNDPRDHFLAPGAELALTQNQVVVEPDHPLGGGQVSEVRYVLLPMVSQATQPTPPPVAWPRLGQALRLCRQHVFSIKSTTIA